MFKCSKCGCCCMALNELYSDLDRGDGVCMHLDISNGLCRIYSDRPLKCRVDDFYDSCLSDKISREDYYRLNYEVCARLQASKGI